MIQIEIINLLITTKEPSTEKITLSGADAYHNGINKINEKIKQCPTIDEIFEKIKESNIGVLSISFTHNWSGPYSSYCLYDTTCLELDGEEKIISYNKEKFYEIYNRMIKELKNYNVQLIDSKTVRFNRIN